MAASPLALTVALALFGPAPVPQVGDAAAGGTAKSGGKSAASSGGAATAGAPEAAAGASFETLGHGALRTRDIATLLSSIIERCENEKRDIDRARCQATTAYLRRTLPEKTFAYTTDEPGVVAVSDYDAAVKGYHVALAGCVACTKPVAIGHAKEPRFVTLKVPEKQGDSLAAAVSLSRNTFGFDSLAEAKRWLDTERPFLRAEFLFQPQIVGDVWTFGASRGVALKLVGARVYNRCTGDVLVSKPPSTTMVDRPGPGREDPSCKARAAAEASAAPPPPAEDRPAQLSQALIADAMAKIRPQVFACYQQFKVPGMIELAFVVAGNGTVQSVSVSPAWRGTPTGLCVRDAVKDAHFPSFQLDEQKFSYPFFLRQ